MADPTPLLDLAAVKVNLRVNATTEDDLITGLILDAQDFVERETGLVLSPRALTETADTLGRWIELASWPVTAVTAIRYPVAGVMTDLDTGAWQVSDKARPARLIPTSWGWGGAARLNFLSLPQLPVEIDVEAGYATPDLIPRNATRAMQMLVAHWYENRQTAEVGVRAAAIEVPFGVTALLRRLRLQHI